MKIAEVSKRYGVSTDTLRYYERIGLLRHVPRNKSGIRDYDEASCNAVEFVKCMRDAGMSIESLVEYMELLEQGDETTAARGAAHAAERRDPGAHRRSGAAWRVSSTRSSTTTRS
ncbi:MAG: MerR family transcriptional regulator [Adlercreutzia equolifaciens]